MTLTNQQVSIETALTLLAKTQRRSILSVMINRDENVVPFDELVEHVGQERSSPESNRATDPSNRKLRLRHIHLPRLEAAGILEYDESRNMVQYQPNDRVEKLHTFVTEELE